jgi:MFS family permease
MKPPGDDPPPRSPTARSVWTAGYRGTSAGIAAVLSIVAFEAFAVITVLPDALSDLHALKAYGLAFGLYLTLALFSSVMAGGLADRFGAVPAFAGGAGLLAAGSAVVGVAPGVAALLAGRALQGAGAGLLTVILYVIVQRRYPARLRPGAFALMAGAWVVPAVAGPPLAASLSHHLGWRWAFLPIPVLLLPAAAFLARGTGAPAAHGPGPPRPGLVRLAAGTASGGALGLYAAQTRSPLAAAVAAATAAALLALTLPRLLPPGTLRAAPGTPAFVLLRGLFAGAFFGIEILLPLLIADRPAASWATTGLVIGTGSIGWAIGAWIPSRRPADRPPGSFLLAACLLMAAGFIAVLACASPRVPLGTAAVGWFAAGTGMGLGLTTANRHAMEGSAERHHGRVSSSLQVSDSIATIVTTGVCTAIVTGGTVPTGTPERFVVALTLPIGVIAFAGAVVLKNLRPSRRERVTEPS